MSGKKISLLAFILLIMSVGMFMAINYNKNNAALTIPETEAGTEKAAEEKKTVRRIPGAIFYEVPDMDKVKVTKDIVYKVDGNVQQELDVYYPAEEDSLNKPYPVILIHGSTSDKNFKDRAYFDSWGRVIAASGFAGITFNWRYGTEPEDISSLVVYVREHAEELGIDSTGMSVIAFSAGVENGVREVASADKGQIRSIVAYYGKLPLSVVESMGNKLPPLFIARAGLDEIFEPDCNKEFIAKAGSLGCEITEVIHEVGVHGFDVFTDDERTRDIIKESLTFIKNNINK